jgi:hypothetical protein
MKGLAITSMILGILAIVLPMVSCGVMAPFGSLLALIALIFGSVSLSKYNNSPNLEGKGMAKAGLVLSIIVLAGNIMLMVACGGLGALGVKG